jgi:hypothetical protein
MLRPDQSQINRLYASEAEKISLHVYLRYVLAENKRWQLDIIVDEMTTAEELRDSWGDIDKAREDLKLWQGTDPNRFSVALMLDLEQRRLSNSSYGKLAMDMNFDALVYLLWAMDESKGKERARAGQLAFINHMQGLGIRSEDVHEWEDQGRAEIAEGRLPWTLKRGPIKRQRIIDALRQFKIEQESKKTVITPTTTADYLTNIRITVYIFGYWKKARDLFQSRVLEKEYMGYEKRLNAREMELIQKAVEFSGLNTQ